MAFCRFFQHPLLPLLRCRKHITATISDHRAPSVHTSDCGAITAFFRALWIPNNAPRRSASLTWAHAPTNPTTAAHVLRNAFVCARSPLLPLLRCRLAEKKQNWNFCSFCTRTLLPVTRDEHGVRGQNFARAGAKVSSTTYRDTEPPAYNLHASPQPRARRTHPTRNIRNGPTKRLESRNKAFPLDNMGSPPHVKLEPVCALGRAAAATQLLST